jgi:tetratricopeptide (TPR) repeat protein
MTTGEEHLPSSAEDLYYSALDKYADGDLTGAVAAFRACLEIDPAMLDAMHGLIRALEDIGDIDEAIDLANQLAETDPDDTLAYTRLSILYQRKGMVPEAEAAATKAKLLGWKQQLRQQKEQSGNL